MVVVVVLEAATAVIVIVVIAAAAVVVAVIIVIIMIVMIITWAYLEVVLRVQPPNKYRKNLNTFTCEIPKSTKEPKLIRVTREVQRTSRAKNKAWKNFQKL